jgi:type III secretory pathway component EscS
MKQLKVKTQLEETTFDFKLKNLAVIGVFLVYCRGTSSCLERFKCIILWATCTAEQQFQAVLPFGQETEKERH